MKIRRSNLFYFHTLLKMFLDRRNYSDVQLNSLKLNSLTIYQGFKMVFSLKSRLHRLEIGSATLQTVLSISQSPNTRGKPGKWGTQSEPNESFTASYVDLFYEIICDILHDRVFFPLMFYKWQIEMGCFILYFLCVTGKKP